MGAIGTVGEAELEKDGDMSEFCGQQCAWRREEPGLWVLGAVRRVRAEQCLVAFGFWLKRGPAEGFRLPFVRSRKQGSNCSVELEQLSSRDENPAKGLRNLTPPPASHTTFRPPAS